MKTTQQIQELGEEIAHSVFYCDNGEPWAPFENDSQEAIEEWKDALVDVIVTAMQWASK